ncbi:toll/interleukin-1 receptor (TIR) domain-containing protein [Artemisia annua]|uniref:Toll/interleukin-1 receptor (TIR) domain-containing protein n=1 Tax=Artemisia annua TaxID=35608 RepID=A0A2U1NT50_ARTAN|nr:toll/interleukin-1 receptor (TIR) domain-containing protein [Artemisia annua]
MASSSSGGYVSRYDVFLSFRGETRNKFTDHLYDKLLRAGIFTFRDDDAIPRGEELTPGIERGIRESRASIIVLSELYATSRWCLDELCLILEQRRDRNHYVLPIFYHVDPSHVRKQEGTFEINVAPKKKWTEDKVERWKAALTKVGHMTGEVASSTRPETKLLEDIVDLIRKRLDLKQVYRQANLVGMENRDKEINSWLEQSDSDILAIWGMDGGGKTTLSRHIAYSNWTKFDSVSIIEDIASRAPEGLRQLQEKLIKDIIEGKEQTNPSSWQGTYTIESVLERRKALIILDNIVTKKQLEALVGIGTRNNTQSKIIITTEKSGSSKWFKFPSWRCQEYEMKLLDYEDSYKLLKLHAFEPDDPTEDYEELANKVLEYCQGHPLALEVLGSCLKDDKRKDVWESRFKSFERELHGDIKKVLRIRYDSLPLGSDRSLFLHIACFFIGKNKDFVGKILEPDYSAISGIITLTKSCLLFVSPNNKLNMHPLLKEMGRTIVYDESPQRPGKRSRLWRNEDSRDVLINKKGSTKVEGLALDMEMLSKEHVQLLNLKTDSFKKMNYLKLLKLNQLEQVTGSYNKFSKNLRWLCWRDFRLDKIPPKLDMGKLVAIDLSCSKLEVFEPPKVLESLKFLNLKESDNLEKIENISRLPNLQKLNLQNCGTLVRVHDTLGDLISITSLNLTGCKNLCKRAKLSEGDNRNQPYFLLPNSLKRLLLKGCNLEDTHYFPLNFKDQPLLEYVNLADNPVEHLPSYTHLYNLRVLDLSCCRALKKLLCLPSKLAELYIFHCNSLETVTFELHKYNLQEFRYEGCVNLSVVEDFFKVVLVAMLTEAELGHMSWLRAYQGREVSLIGDDDLTKGRSLCLQMQNLTSDYKYTSEHDFLSFSVPKSPMNRRLKGLNLTFKYTIQGDTWVWFAKIKTNKGVDLIYNPKVFGKPASDEVGIWLSYWPIGKSLHVGDEVDVSIIVTTGLEIYGCGASLVYAGEEDEDESCEVSNKSFVENHESFEDANDFFEDANDFFEDANDFFEDNNEHADILGGDISGFKLTNGTYYLCRRDYSQLMEVGRLTPNWFRDLVGDTIDYTEIGGWRKTGRPDQPYQSYTELKTARCIIYGPELVNILCNALG